MTAFFVEQDGKFLPIDLYKAKDAEAQKAGPSTLKKQAKAFKKTLSSMNLRRSSRKQPEQPQTSLEVFAASRDFTYITGLSASTIDWALDADRQLARSAQKARREGKGITSGQTITSTQRSKAQVDRLKDLARVEEVNIGSTFWDRNWVPLLGDLIDRFEPFTSGLDHLRKLPSLFRDPAAAALFIDPSQKEEEAENSILGTSTFRLANIILWHVSRAASLCSAQGSLEEQNKFKHILDLLAVDGDYLTWEAAPSKVEGRPGITKSGTPDFTLWRRNDFQKALGAQCNSPLDGRSRKLTKVGAAWQWELAAAQRSSMKEWAPKGQAHQILAQCAGQCVIGNTSCGALLFDHGRGLLPYTLKAVDANVVQRITKETLYAQNQSPGYKVAFSEEAIYTQHSASRPPLAEQRTALPWRLKELPSMPIALVLLAVQALQRHCGNERPFPGVSSDDLASLQPLQTRASLSSRLASVSEEPESSGAGLSSRQPRGSSSLSSVGVARGGTGGAHEALGNVLEETRLDTADELSGIVDLEPISELSVSLGELRIDSSSPSRSQLPSLPPVTRDLSALLSASGWQGLRPRESYRYVRIPFATGATAAAHQAIFNMAGGPRTCIIKVLDDSLDEQAAATAFLVELRALTDPELVSAGVVVELLGTLSPQDEPRSLLPKLIVADAPGRSVLDLFIEIAGLKSWQKTTEDRLLWDAVFDVVYSIVSIKLSLVHRAGWLHGDLHGNNIFVQVEAVAILKAAQQEAATVEESQVCFIDFGSGYRPQTDARDKEFKDEDQELWDALRVALEKVMVLEDRIA
ncbi:unnamed protein product [Sympodiomycopsis kandeliae]